MNTLIIGNIIALIATSASIMLGFIKSREKIIFIQVIQSIFFTISNFILGSFTGIIINLINILRNWLCYKDKLTNCAILIITIISIFLTLMFNNLGFVGLLPLFSNIVYTFLMNTKDNLKFKLLVLFTMIPWAIHDIFIKSYTSAFFDIATTISCSFCAYQIYKDKKLNKQQN